MQNASDDRECENQLVLLLGFDQFDFIRTLRQHRLMVLYCTLLAQSQTTDERAAIERRMTELGETTRRILDALREVDEKDIVETERDKRDRARQQRREAEAGHVTDMVAGAVSNWLAQRQMLDLQELAFESGSHMMANKRCQLPDGSFRKQTKSYEEVHVPALKPKPYAENEVSSCLL